MVSSFCHSHRSDKEPEAPWQSEPGLQVAGIVWPTSIVQKKSTRHIKLRTYNQVGLSHGNGVQDKVAKSERERV